MFWIFMLVAAGAATFTVLGMYSVWIKVLSFALLLAVLALTVLIITLIWQKVFRKGETN